jgi:hypothetical protein
VGFAVTEKLRDAIGLVPMKVWAPAHSTLTAGSATAVM